MRGYVQEPAAGKGWAGDNGGPKAQSLGLAATRCQAGSESSSGAVTLGDCSRDAHIAKTARRSVERER